MLAFTFNSSGALAKNHHLVNTSRNKRFPSKLWPILPWLFKNYTAIHPQYFSFKNATSATFLIIHWWEHWVCKLVWKCLIPNCTVMHILKMLLLKVMQPPTEWASSTGYFSQSDTPLWHTLSLNWPTATERAADPCVEADLSSTQPTQERQKPRTRLLKERETLTGAGESAVESHHLYPTPYLCLAKMNHSPGEKEPETTEPLRYLR